MSSRLAVRAQMERYIAELPEAQHYKMYYNIISAAISITVLFAEYFQTLELEVELVWPSEWSLVKFLYFTNRMMPFIAIPFSLLYNMAPTPSPSFCKSVFLVCCIGIWSCIIISEAVLYIRLYALAGRGRKMRWFLICNAFCGIKVAFTGGFLLTILYVTSGSWNGSQSSKVVPGCFGNMSGQGHLLLVAYLLILYSGLMTMAFCVYFGLKVYWKSKPSPLIRIFYRDGTFYFVALAVMSIANGAAALFLPSRFRFLLTPPQAVMHSTLAIRMILHLREESRQELGITSVSEIIFNTQHPA
ncbi:hypothetical protein FA15DRAFT_705889 [Coprinopsis marcescibilis]|uniref:DUF6533 domain-containing protein n=1 Tax=Coprinopsis marcescibilis TaxID=230819 RepID=A0A5C3KRD6_COPMA|nr:hypothetical protein FA15DRAFT_705889 [Coprinopsis marcescibilis]